MRLTKGVCFVQAVVWYPLPRVHEVESVRLKKGVGVCSSVAPASRALEVESVRFKQGGWFVQAVVWWPLPRVHEVESVRLKKGRWFAGWFVQAAVFPAVW